MSVNELVAALQVFIAEGHGEREVEIYLNRQHYGIDKLYTLKNHNVLLITTEI